MGYKLGFQSCNGVLEEQPSMLWKTHPQTPPDMISTLKALMTTQVPKGGLAEHTDTHTHVDVTCKAATQSFEHSLMNTQSVKIMDPLLDSCVRRTKQHHGSRTGSLCSSPGKPFHPLQSRRRSMLTGTLNEGLSSYREGMEPARDTFVHILAHTLAYTRTC